MNDVLNKNSRVIYLFPRIKSAFSAMLVVNKAFGMANALEENVGREALPCTGQDALLVLLPAITQVSLLRVQANDEVEQPVL